MTDSNDALIGQLAAGRYRVLERLGEGGMGRVYLAEHVAIEKRVALKVLHAEYAKKSDVVARFQREAISASRIKHPNVLDVFDFGQLDDGCFYLAMEFLDGWDLADELARRTVLDTATGIRVSIQICRALAAAHENGVVHRDMKPENVFLQRTQGGDEVVKIVDFGIAQLRSKEDVETGPGRRRLTRTGVIFGTPEYMAPEQASGKHADARSDLYAVGIIMYEMFTGALPFTGDTFLGVLTRHLNDAVPSMNTVYSRLNISPELEAVIMRALEKDPERRFQTMLELSQAITLTAEAEALGYRPAVGSKPEQIAFTAPERGAPAPPEGPPEKSRVAPTVIRRAAQPARAETQLGAEAVQRVRARSRGGRAAAAASLGALAVSGFWLGSKSHPAVSVAREPAAAQRTESRLPTTASSVVRTAPVEPSSAGPSVPVATPNRVIKLEVSSAPSGATLSKNGFQVCAATPCEVLAAPDEALLFEAAKSGLKGSAKVLAEHDQKVVIELSGNGAAAPAKHTLKRPAPSSLCEMDVDGLKILRPCK